MSERSLQASPPLAAAADVQPLAFNWAFNPWLVVLAVAVAGVATVYLYRAQRRVASRRVVASLTGIRVTLVALMLLLLAGPVVQRVQSRESGGTLWMLVDQSLSMDHADRQLTPAERLAWADTLGLLPAGSPAPTLGRRATELAALRTEFAHLRTRSQLASDEPDVPLRVAALGRQVQAWDAQLQALAGRLEQDARAEGPGDTTTAGAAALRAASRGVEAGVEQSAERATLDEAAAAVPWAATLKALDEALATLRPMADQADAAFLAGKQGDRAVQDALAKVAGMKRIELALAALAGKSRHGDTGLADLLAKPNTKVVAFADAPLPVSTATDAAKLAETIKPAGHSTDLAGALRWVNEQTGPDERATVVVLSDGRQTGGGAGSGVGGAATGGGGGADLVEPSRVLASRDVRVFTIAVGSAGVVPDATVEQLDAPDWIYKDDTFRAAALLRLDGLAGKPVTVEFRRVGKAGTSEVVKSETVTPGGDRETKLVSFEDRPADAGRAEYEIVIQPVAEESVAENNARRLGVTVKRDKLNALVIEDQPRWEYRYLTNYLERDARVKLQKVLLQPATIAAVDRPPPVMASPENASPEAQLLPDAPEKWAAFDLVVLGDVPPERFGPQQQAMLAKAVRDRGTSLVMIAGRSNLPSRYVAGAGDDSSSSSSSGTSSREVRGVHDLLPVELTGAWSPPDYERHLKDGFRPVVTAEGAASVLGQFTMDESGNAALWSAIPAWYWHGEQTRAKLSASVLWAIAEPAAGGNAATTSPDTLRDRALLATMSIGLGRVLYLAGDSTWRLRQVEGENLHERFWGQVVRWAVGGDLPAGGRLVKFGADKPRYVAGEPVTVTARLLGKDMAPLVGKRVKAVAHLDGKRLNETALAESPETPGYYVGTLASLPPGRVELTLEGPEAQELLSADPTVVTKSLAVDVLPHRDDERQNITADPAALARVAEAGGGIAVPGAHADLVASHLPQLSFTTADVQQAGLFADPEHAGTRRTHWAFLTLFVGLLTAEWVIRKAGGLV